MEALVLTRFADVAPGEVFIDPALPNIRMRKFTQVGEASPGFYRPLEGGNQYWAGASKKVWRIISNGKQQGP